ncbi:hypothetical protein FA13DRAFT_1714905 [Coprinellus micaceus]|uniref:Uncharacterized protein n=1 Tax=Coprinellus micaceus TaxID=71717 RepID=A0A4Y7SQL5_COPMI|nr:hypothetical protein FA13DRAFT_1714905 [Coprinellus micaceus]
MSESLEHPTHPPFVETIPPQIVSTPTSLQDLNQQAQEFEAFILKHRHDPTLESVLSTTLPSFEVACKRLGEPQGKLPALRRLRVEVANGRPFAGYMVWLETKIVVKTPALAPHGLSHKCLYPSAKAAVCVICKARKRPCVCNERRAVLGLEPKEKEALAPKLRASHIGHLDGAEDSTDDLTALPSFSGPQQGGDPSGTETLDFSAGIGVQDVTVHANLDGVSARLATLQGIISSAAECDAMQAFSPLVGEEAATRAAFDLHSLFMQLGPLRPTDRQYEPFKQLIERFLNVTNHQLALHLEFTKAVTNLLPVLTESADLINKFAETAGLASGIQCKDNHHPICVHALPTTEREVLTAARALERFIIANRAHEGLEEALGKVLPQFDEGWAKINCDVTGCPALERYYQHQEGRRTFCGVSDVAPSDRENSVCATPHDINQPQSATSNPMTSPASSAPLYTVECEPPTPPSEVPASATVPAQPASGPPAPPSDSGADPKKRKAEAGGAPKAKKKKVTDDPDKVYTRDDPGNCFVPPQAEACDWCKTHGRVEECLFPTDQSTTCVVCKRRRQSCVADQRRHALGKPAFAKDPIRSKRPTIWKQGRYGGVKSGAKAEGSRSSKSGAGTSTSTAVRKDQASKSTARRDPFVLIPHHTLNLHAYKALSDMGPTQQVYGEAISADVGAQQISRVDDTMTRDMAEVQSRVEALRRFADQVASSAMVAEILPLIPPETLAAAEEALKAAIDGIKVPPAPAGRYSYKSLIEQSLNLIQGQLDRGTAIQRAMADLSGPLASAESTFVSALEELRTD